MGKSNASMSWYLQLFITAPVLSLRHFRAAALVLGFQTWKDSNAGTDRVVFADAGLATTAKMARQSPKKSDVALSFMVVLLLSATLCRGSIFIDPSSTPGEVHRTSS